MPITPAPRTTRSFRSLFAATLLAALMSGLFAGLAPAPAAALSADTTIGCGMDRSVGVTYARLPVTASGQAGWSYSVFYVGDARNPWVRSNWLAAYANAGAVPSYEFVNGAWARPAGPSINIQAPPHYGNLQVWQQKWEIVNGRWSAQWVYLGGCTPPPGA